jgi:hypothetical protein
MAPEDAMAAAIYDGSQWPLFRVRLPKEGMSEEEFRHYLDTVDALFLRKECFVLVIDARVAPLHTPKERQEVAERVRFSYEHYPRGMAAMAILLETALQRGIFTAITWLSPRTFPVRAFATQAKAESWLREALGTRAPTPAPAHPEESHPKGP